MILKTSRSIFENNNIFSHLEELEKKSNTQEFWNKENIENVKLLNNLQKQVKEYLNFKENLDDLKVMLEFNKQDENEFKEEIEENIKKLSNEISKYKTTMLLSDKYDSFSAIVSINSGAGGLESFDFVEMLFNMYQKWVNKNSYKLEILDYLKEDVGFKNITFEVSGQYAYGLLKTEIGVHRMVRISPYDANKKRHTTFAAVSVLPLLDDDISIEIRPEDIEIDTYRASGAGGQHVNTTNSAVRIRHIKTNIVVTCQNERSQIKNKDYAIKILKSKLFELEMKNRKDELKEIKGKEEKIEWGSQIRSYVMQPYELVKDHRTKYEQTNVKEVLQGDIDNFILEMLKNVN